jgi:GTPase SAR1 family protein
MEQATELTTIILNQSDHAKNFDTKYLVHKNEFDVLIGFINRALRLAENEPEKEYLHNTITLLGTRGSGKTSFLLSVLEWIKKEKKDETRHIDLSSVQVLEIIDPTLIEEKGHVFLNVISLIAGLVERELDKEECNSNNDRKSPTRKVWRASLNELAAGLPSIDGVGSHTDDGWQDPEFIMDVGLKAVAASQNLFKNFNKFLELSLNALGKKAFLLIFDDIDVDASKGWAVLETIRKYFTGSRLITLISGDLELYTTVVRQKKWQNFGKEILKYEGTHADKESRLGEFAKLVTKLTGQYMLKIMQPQYRVHLNTLLHRRITRKRLDIQIAFDDKSDGIGLEDLYRIILADYGIVNKVEFEAFTTFILSQPLRSQIQFLHLFSFRYGQREERNPIDNNALADVFLSDLLDQKVDISIAANTPKYLASVILSLLLDKQNLEDLYQLQPTTTNESLNASLYTLSLLLANTIQNNRFVIFDFIIKIGYLRNLMTLLPYRNDNSLDDKQRPSIEDLCSRTGVLHDGILRDVTGKILTYLYGTLELENNVNDITPFFIQLKALKSLSRQRHTDRIDAVFAQQNVNKAQKILGYIPCFAGTFNYKNESRVGYSFYLLLAAIGEIVKEYETILKESGESEEMMLLKQLLKELSQLRNYPIIGFVKKQIDTTIRVTIDEEDSLEDHDNSDDKTDDHLAYAILKWLRLSGSITAASHLLGKITTRFFYAMNNIAEAVTKNITLDELFHRQVIAFMNAVLVEDIRGNLEGRSSRLNINNTNTDDSVFINNLKAMVGPRGRYRSDTLGFSKWMLSCPLLLAYLRIDKNRELMELLNRYSRIDDEGYGQSQYAISHLLHLVGIRSQENRDNEDLYQIVDGTPDLLDTHEELVQILQSHGIPYEWFVEGEDRGETMRRNNLIRRYISSIFLDDNRTSGRIRTFRNYLVTNNIRW